MTLYVDTSALLKRYVEGRDSERAIELLSSDRELVTGRHTAVEVRRNLARLLPATAASAARTAFAEDVASLSIIELDAATCELAVSDGRRPPGTGRASIGVLRRRRLTPFRPIVVMPSLRVAWRSDDDDAVRVPVTDYTLSICSRSS